MSSESPHFCSNPDCQLHVRAGDLGVEGSGNWAVLADGRIVGRGLYGDATLCDPCGRDYIKGEKLERPAESISCEQAPERARRRVGR